MPEDDETFEIKVPKRIAHKTEDPKEFEIPELPANADQLPELTVEFRAADGTKKIVSRSNHRVHLDMPSRNQEWLFLRNPVDGRRVTGILIDHAHRVLLDYPETDLRIEGVARGWADVVAFDETKGTILQRGVDPKLIQDPKTRFPKYGDFDIADWREELHENGHDHAGHHPSPSPLVQPPAPTTGEVHDHHQHPKE